MRHASAYLRTLVGRAVHEDDGMTLMDLIVGMLIMVIFLGIFTGATYTMAQTVNQVQAVTTSSAQVNAAFLNLDKMVRYVGAISTTGKGTSGDWYVEFDKVESSTSVETCTQLRVDNSRQVLQQRTWTATGATTYTSLSGWSALASQITNGTATAGSMDQPFTVPAALGSAATGFQRLTITVVAATGPKSSSPTRSVMTFTALNSTASASTNAAKCQQAGRP